MTFIFRPRARSQTIPPMFPAPITPSVLPVSSTPMNLDFSHFPACVDSEASGIWRATANIIAIACSAVVIILPKGVFITMTPCFDAASLSTLSVPMPARPTTFRLVACFKIVGVTLVADRMARPSYCPITSANFSLSLPRSGMKSTSIPRSRKIWTAVSLSLSDTSTLGAMIILILWNWYAHPLVGDADYSILSVGYCAAISCSKAHSNHGSIATMSDVSTVPPHQTRNPAGASR